MDNIEIESAINEINIINTTNDISIENTENNLQIVQEQNNIEIEVPENNLELVFNQNGANGVGIVSIEKTSTVDLIDTYTITYTNKITSTFEVTNGTVGSDGNTPYIEDGYWFINGVSTGVKAQGEDGKDGLTTSVNNIEQVNGNISLTTDDIPDTATNRYTNDTDIARLANTSGTNTGDNPRIVSQVIVANYAQSSAMDNGKVYTYIRDADNVIIETIIEEV